MSAHTQNVDALNAVLANLQKIHKRYLAVPGIDKTSLDIYATSGLYKLQELAELNQRCSPQEVTTRTNIILQVLKDEKKSLETILKSADVGSTSLGLKKGELFTLLHASSQQLFNTDNFKQRQDAGSIQEQINLRLLQIVKTVFPEAREAVYKAEKNKSKITDPFLLSMQTLLTVPAVRAQELLPEIKKAEQGLDAAIEDADVARITASMTLSNLKEKLSNLILDQASAKQEGDYSARSKAGVEINDLETKSPEMLRKVLSVSKKAYGEELERLQELLAMMKAREEALKAAASAKGERVTERTESLEVIIARGVVARQGKVGVELTQRRLSDDLRAKEAAENALHQAMEVNPTEVSEANTNLLHEWERSAMVSPVKSWETAKEKALAEVREKEMKAREAREAWDARGRARDERVRTTAEAKAREEKAAKVREEKISAETRAREAALIAAKEAKAQAEALRVREEAREREEAARFAAEEKKHEDASRLVAAAKAKETDAMISMADETLRQAQASTETVKERYKRITDRMQAIAPAAEEAKPAPAAEEVDSSTLAIMAGLDEAAVTAKTYAHPQPVEKGAVSHITPPASTVSLTASPASTPSRTSTTSPVTSVRLSPGPTPPAGSSGKRTPVSRATSASPDVAVSRTSSAGVHGTPRVPSRAASTPPGKTSVSHTTAAAKTSGLKQPFSLGSHAADKKKSKTVSPALVVAEEKPGRKMK